MPYADDPVRSAPHAGRGGAAYRDACAEVRERARRGERCCFWRKRGHEACPGRINLTLRANHRWGFTAHHKHRLMDGGRAVVRSEDMAPAHRACNARDGLIAQNERRRKWRAARVLRPDLVTRGPDSYAYRGVGMQRGPVQRYGPEVSESVPTSNRLGYTKSSVVRDRVSRAW